MGHRGTNTGDGDTNDGGGQKRGDLSMKGRGCRGDTKDVGSQKMGCD